MRELCKNGLWGLFSHFGQLQQRLLRCTTGTSVVLMHGAKPWSSKRRARRRHVSWGLRFLRLGPLLGHSVISAGFHGRCARSRALTHGIFVIAAIRRDRKLLNKWFATRPEKSSPANLAISQVVQQLPQSCPRVALRVEFRPNFCDFGPNRVAF